jgi:sarcosine oxidase subunit gamma
MFERRTALAGLLRPRPASSAASPLVVGEESGFALLQVSAFIDTVGELDRIVRRVLGASLPQRMGSTGRSPNHHIFKIGPEQFWIVGSQEAWIASLQDGVPREIGATVSLSHGRARLFIDGASSRAVLSSGIALDLQPEVFRPDAYALTDLQHTPVLLHRTDQHRYELYVLRTYAVWVWEWLTDAALPFGFEVAAAPAPTIEAPAGRE